MSFNDKKLEEVCIKLNRLSNLIDGGNFELKDAECMKSAVRSFIPQDLELQCYEFLISEKGDLSAIRDYINRAEVISRYSEKSNEHKILIEYLSGIEEIRIDIQDYLNE
jgi:hypothetical protein